MPDGRSALPLAIAVLIAAGLIGVDLIWRAPGESLTRENGGLETATAALYAYAAGWWLRLTDPAAWRRYWHVPLVLVMMAGRELDLDVRLTSQGILTSAMYFTDRAPLWERLLGGAIVALLVVILYRLIALSGRRFGRGLKARALGAWAVAGGIGIAVVAVNIDGIGRKLRPLGIELPDGVDAAFGAAEEAIELFIPILFLVAILEATRAGTADHA